jgi:hypothetical protein
VLKRAKPDPEALSALEPSWEGSLDDLITACGEFA